MNEGEEIKTATGIPKDVITIIDDFLHSCNPERLFKTSHQDMVDILLHRIWYYNDLGDNLPNEISQLQSIHILFFNIRNVIYQAMTKKELKFLIDRLVETPIPLKDMFNYLSLDQSVNILMRIEKGDLCSLIKIFEDANDIIGDIEYLSVERKNYIYNSLISLDIQYRRRS